MRWPAIDELHDRRCPRRGAPTPGDQDIAGFAGHDDRSAGPGRGGRRGVWSRRRRRRAVDDDSWFRDTGPIYASMTPSGGSPSTGSSTRRGGKFAPWIRTPPSLAAAEEPGTRLDGPVRDAGGPSPSTAAARSSRGPVLHPPSYGKHAGTSPTTRRSPVDDVELAAARAYRELVELVLPPRYDRATPAERRLPARHGRSAAARALGGRRDPLRRRRRPSSATTSRAGSSPRARRPAHRRADLSPPSAGVLAFTVPHMAGYLRQLPERPGEPSGRSGVRLAVITAAGRRVAAGLPVRSSSSTTPLLLNDSLYYSIQAGRNSEGDWFREGLTDLPGAEHGPLTSLYLTPWSLRPGDLVRWQRFGMTLLGIATVAVIGLVGRRLAGPCVGLVAAAIAAVYPNLWINDSLVMSESLALPARRRRAAASPSLRPPAEPRSRRRPRRRRRARRARPAARSLLFAIGFAGLAWWRAAGSPRRACCRCSCVVAGGADDAPWTLYNLTRFDRPVLLSTNDGTTLLGANCDSTYFDDIGGWDIRCLGPCRPTARSTPRCARWTAARSPSTTSRDHVGRLPSSSRPGSGGCSTSTGWSRSSPSTWARRRPSGRCGPGIVVLVGAGRRGGRRVARARPAGRWRRTRRARWWLAVPVAAGAGHDDPVLRRPPHPGAGRTGASSCSPPPASSPCGAPVVRAIRDAVEVHRSPTTRARGTLGARRADLDDASSPRCAPSCVGLDRVVVAFSGGRRLGVPRRRRPRARSAPSGPTPSPPCRRRWPATSTTTAARLADEWGLRWTAVSRRTRWPAPPTASTTSTAASTARPS